jgi:hypothetical protein
MLFTPHFSVSVNTSCGIVWTVRPARDSRPSPTGRPRWFERDDPPSLSGDRQLSEETGQLHPANYPDTIRQSSGGNIIQFNPLVRRESGQNRGKF